MMEWLMNIQKREFFLLKSYLNKRWGVKSNEPFSSSTIFDTWEAFEWSVWYISNDSIGMKNKYVLFTCENR